LQELSSNNTTIQEVQQLCHKSVHFSHFSGSQQSKSTTIKFS
jgi:hypothetical protein